MNIFLPHRNKLILSKYHSNYLMVQLYRLTNYCVIDTTTSKHVTSLSKYLLYVHSIRLVVQDSGLLSCCSILTSLEKRVKEYTRFVAISSQCSFTQNSLDLLWMQVLAYSIRKSDLDLRKTFYSNIVLSGGSTLFKGLQCTLNHTVFIFHASEFRITVMDCLYLRIVLVL